jgi:hypothetical protein
MTAEGAFDRFQRRRRESVAEMRDIRDQTDAILDRIERHEGVGIQDLAMLEGLRAQRARAFETYQSAEDELINALLATLKSERENA